MNEGNRPRRESLSPHLAFSLQRGEHENGGTETRMETPRFTSGAPPTTVGLYPLLETSPEKGISHCTVVSYGCPYQVPQSGQLKQQTVMFSLSCKREVPGQGGQLAPSGGCEGDSPARPLPVSLHTVSPCVGLSLSPPFA